MSIYGESIFESTDLVIEKLTESINNDFDLFDGLISESVINEGVKEVFSHIIEGIKKLIEAIKKKINDISVKVKSNIISKKWEKKLKSANLPVTFSYVNIDTLLSDMEKVNWHTDNVYKLADSDTITEDEVKKFRNDIDNIRSQYIGYGEKFAKQYFTKISINSEEMVDGFINTKLKDHITDLNKMIKAVESPNHKLYRMNDKFKIIANKFEKNLDNEKTVAFRELAHYAYCVAGAMQELIKICNMALVPHIEGEQSK